MKRSVLCILITVILVLILLPAAVNAEEVASGTCGDSLTWSLDDAGVLTISGSGYMDSYSVTSGITNAPWGEYNAAVKEVVIEDGVSSIGEYTFYGMNSLESVTIAGSVGYNMDSYAFAYCNALTTVTLEEGVINVGNYAFESCGALTDVSFPSTFGYISQYGFHNCTGLTAIRLPDTATGIGKYAFSGCTNLSSVNIPSRLNSLGEYAFNNTAITGDIVLPEASITTLARNTFANCPNLTGITAKGVTSVGEYCFYNCTSLASVTFSDDLRYLHQAAFYNTAISSVPPMPNGYELPPYCFYNCPNLVNAVVTEGVCRIGYTSQASYVFSACANLESLDIPASVHEIGRYAVTGDPKLTDITIRGVLTEVADYAFYNINSDAEVAFTMKTKSSSVGRSYANVKRTVYGIPGGTVESNATSSSYNYTFKAATNNIHFDANAGGANVSGSMDDWTITFKGTTEDCIPKNNFVCEGATFEGWWPSPERPDWTLNYWDDEEQLTEVLAVNGGNVTLYALWKPNEEYNLYVNGTRVNSMNAPDVLGDGTVSFDAATNTLILDGYDSSQHTGNYEVKRFYSGSSWSAFDTATVAANIPDLTIEVVGDSIIRNQGTWDLALFSGKKVTLKIAEGKTLTLDGAKGGYYTAYGNNNIDVKGPGTLVINGTLQNGAYAFYTGTMTIDDDAQVRIRGDFAENGNGCSCDMVVQSGYLLITANRRAIYWITAGDGLRIYAGDDAENVTVFSGTQEFSDYDYKYVRVSAPQKFTVKVTAGTGMTLTDGPSPQDVVEGEQMERLTFTAEDGYYFPEDYTVAAPAGLRVYQSGYQMVRVIGMPLENATFKLPAATAKVREDVSAVEFEPGMRNCGRLTGIEPGAYYRITYRSSRTDEAEMTFTTEETTFPLEDILAGDLTVVRLTTDPDTRLDSKPKTIKVSFAAVPIKNAKITGLADKTYTGAAITQKLKLTATVDGVTETLKQGTDYTVKYAANTAVGQATVTITGKGNYTGSVKKTFKITPVDLAAAASKTTVSGVQASYPYTGAAQKPAPTVKATAGNKARTLKAGTDYTVKYTANTAVGQATLTITGKGNYTGTLKKTFKITQVNLAAAATKTAVSGLKTSYAFTGTAIKPAITVKALTGGKTVTLKAGTDYTVKYGPNLNVGSGTVTITGKGNYTGTVKKTFKITAAPAEPERTYGQDRYQTSLEIAEAYRKELGVSQFSAVCVADGTNYPDALAGASFASANKAPILVINKADPTGPKSKPNLDYIRKYLKKGGSVYILGGEGSVPPAVETILKQAGFKVTRLAGSNRYLSNIAILQAAKIPAGTEFIVTTGADFADALSASATGKPVLLVAGDKLTADQAAYLKAVRAKSFTIVGTTAQVSAGIEKELKTYAPTARITGATAFDRSAALARKYFPGIQIHINLADGRNFPDALCGGPLAVKKGGPLLLTDGSAAANAKLRAYATEARAFKATVLGGPGSISDETVNYILSAK
ncbi:MAG: leucine-rich repeat protein [Clostridia bacterium]|nr:leucine-rich repeat protein [Clostridia bacterium]